MAARQTGNKMQKTLNDFKQERETVTQAIAQLGAVLDLLTGGGAKRRGRPKKVVETTLRRKPGPKPGKKRAAKKAAHTVGKKKPARRGRPPTVR